MSFKNESVSAHLILKDSSKVKYVQFGICTTTVLENSLILKVIQRAVKT